MTMKRILVVALSLALATTAFAQESVVTQQTVTTTEQGGAVRTEVRTVTTQYVTYLRGVYLGIGLPQSIIDQLIRLDLQILEARVQGDFARVRVLLEEEIRLLTPVQVTELRTYITAHPVPVAIPVYAQPVWVSNVTVANNSVQPVFTNESEIRTAVQSANIKVEDLNIESSLKASGSLDTSA